MRYARAVFVGNLILATAVTAATAGAAAPSAVKGGHDRAYWHAIAAHDYALPAGASALGLAEELSGLFAAPDPELRDDLATSIIAAWVERGVLDAAALSRLERAWRANLARGRGERDNDGVLLRSFSALALAAVAARERDRPFLDAAEYRGLLDDALAYLGGERDLRGRDATRGWMHATAHTADLLANLGSCRRLARADQTRILDGLSGRLATADTVFTLGEPDRLAQAALALARRGDLDRAAFTAWLGRLPGVGRDAGSARPAIPAAAPNVKHFTQALAGRLGALPPSPVAAELHQAAQAALRALP